MAAKEPQRPAAPPLNFPSPTTNRQWPSPPVGRESHSQNAAALCRQQPAAGHPCFSSTTALTTPLLTPLSCSLKFFKTIQALQYQKASNNLPQLLRAVSNAFDNLSPQCLRFVFITLQACMIEVMKRQWGIDYHIPHMNKSKAIREGTLYDYLSVDKQLVVKSLQHLFTRISSETMNQLVEMKGYQGGIEEAKIMSLTT